MGPDFFCSIWKVEHGSAACLITPNGRTIMFDCGCSNDFSPADHLKNDYKVERLDKLIISHPHADHISDLPNLMENLKPVSIVRNKSTPPHLVYPNGVSKLSSPLNSWKKMTEEYTARVKATNELSNPDNFGGVQFKTFSCKKEHLSESSRENINNYSLVTVVSYHHTEIVFPGDLEPEGWEALLQHSSLANSVGDRKFRILIAPHHGRKSGIRFSDGRLYKKFMEILRPQLVIISDKRGNDTTAPEDYRSQMSEGLFIDEEEKKIFTTKSHNCISLQCNHTDLWVKRF